MVKGTKIEFRVIKSSEGWLDLFSVIRWLKGTWMIKGG